VSFAWSGLYGLFIGLVSIFIFFTISFFILNIINHNVTYYRTITDSWTDSMSPRIQSTSPWTCGQGPMDSTLTQNKLKLTEIIYNKSKQHINIKLKCLELLSSLFLCLVVHCKYSTCSLCVGAITECKFNKSFSGLVPHLHSKFLKQNIIYHMI